MHALRAFYCLRFRLRNLYAVCIHIIGVLPDQLGDGNWLDVYKRQEENG